MSGKGDDPRPRQISDDEWEDNYRRTFPKAPRKRGQSERDARRIGQLEMPLADK